MPRATRFTRFEIKRKAKPGQFRRWRHALKHDDGAAARIVEQLEQSGLEVTVRMKRPGARWKHTTGDEVMQLRALQLSDRWAPAVQRATRPLAKPV